MPMCGHGQRFKDAGYSQLKPLIPVDDRPMFKVALDCLGVKGTIVFVINQRTFPIKTVINKYYPDSETIQLTNETCGAAETLKYACRRFKDDQPILIVNCDQYIYPGLKGFLSYVDQQNADGGILTFSSTDPKWSYVRTSGDLVIETAEKNPISNQATVGIYFWKKGADFVKYCKQMIEDKATVKGEYYICPVYNWAINDGKKIVAYPTKVMHSFGTPEDLERFKNQYVSR